MATYGGGLRVSNPISVVQSCGIGNTVLYTVPANSYAIISIISTLQSSTSNITVYIGSTSTPTPSTAYPILTGAPSSSPSTTATLYLGPGERIVANVNPDASLVQVYGVEFSNG